MNEFSNYSKNIKRLVSKTYKPCSENFIVSVQSDGLKDKKGYYRIVNGDNMIFMGLAMFNALNPKNPTDIMDSWNPIFQDCVQGKAGFGVLLKSSATQFTRVFPIDAKTVTEFKHFKGLTDFDEKYLSSHSESFWKLAFLETITPEHIEELLKLYNEKVKALGSKLKIHKTEPGNYDKKLWIERGYPCAYRYGFAYRGAKARRIDKNEALKKFGHTFESDYEKLDGIWHLVLQDYSANDMW